VCDTKWLSVTSVNTWLVFNQVFTKVTDSQFIITLLAEQQCTTYGPLIHVVDKFSRRGNDRCEVYFN